MNAKNGFYILEVPPGASQAEIERQGRKLLGMLALDLAQAKTYACPAGRFERDATMVREALARLRDPKARLREATLARVLDGETLSCREDPDGPVREAFLLCGYRGL